MCGLVGFFNPQSENGRTEAALVGEMASRIRHRGPDSSGVWCDSTKGIALAHARLAIVDLSPAGAQPMHSTSDRYILTYNGEIYNHLKMRCDLVSDGWSQPWKGHSDTETLLAGFEQWGIEATIKRSIGMFAIAVWDRFEQQLTLIRDRMGEKPLYYGWQGVGDQRTFLFGSELKALVSHPSFDDEIDRDALALFVRFGYISAPFSIYKGIYKLNPGCILTISAACMEPEISNYWSIRDVIESGINSALDLTPQNAVDELEKILGRAVQSQLISDVPLGAFLSGGVDSSAIVALMQANSVKPVRTFTIGFDDKEFDEALHAKAVAKHLGTNHTELYVQSSDVVDVVPLLPEIFDEPFADHSQIPTYLLAKLTREHVTVALSGDAGDELFGGYGRYAATEAYWNKIERVPMSVRAGLQHAIKAVPAPTWTRLGAFGGRRFAGTASSTFGQLVHKGADQLRSASLADLFAGVSSYWPRDRLVIDGHEPPTPMNSNVMQIGRSSIETLMSIDMQCFLPDDILVKVDRASMAVSLETRVPMLDHRVIEFAWQLPPQLKMRNGISKSILRDLLYRYVPRELVERPKQGFNVPLQHWLRGCLRPWADSMLDFKKLENEGFFNPNLVQAMWQAHISFKGNYHYALWNVLMFESWLEERRKAKRRSV
jgi:asparagine synthase (glutamine-hydrolysing)